MRYIINRTTNLLSTLISSNPAFDFPFPICWFGDLQTEKPIILTLGINPSDVEFSPNYTFGMLTGSIISSSLEKAYNDYFKIKPYKKWFNPQDKILNPLGASYYDDDLSMEYQLVHVDLFPFATNPKWNAVKDKITTAQKRLIFANGMQILQRIIVKYKPKTIISFGALEEKVNALKSLGFHWVNTPAQVPANKRAHKLGYGEISVEDSTIPIILTTAVSIYPIDPSHKSAIISLAHTLGI